jgi:hypothetical protein
MYRIGLRASGRDATGASLLQTINMLQRTASRNALDPMMARIAMMRALQRRLPQRLPTLIGHHPEEIDSNRQGAGPLARPVDSLPLAPVIGPAVPKYATERPPPGGDPGFFAGECSGFFVGEMGHFSLLCCE